MVEGTDFYSRWVYGCGKTLTAIAVIGAGYQLGKISRVLIVAPTSVVGVWSRELAEYADFPFVCAELLGDKKKRIAALDKLNYCENSLAVAVINYESCWRPEIYDAITAWMPDMIIADESQRIKTHDAAQSKAMHRLGDIAAYKMILSGTPVQNNAIDIYSQYRFLDKSVFGSNFYAFKNHYAIMGGFEKRQIVGYRDMEDLIKKEHSVAYRVTKAECLDLPDQTFENRYIRLSDEDQRLYNRLKRESYAELENGGSVTAATVLTKLLRLQQLTGGFLRADDTAEPTKVNTAKIDALREIVTDCRDAGNKLVIFARFTAEIDAISDMLKKDGIRFGRIDGRTPMEERSDVVNDFQTNTETLVFVAQIQTAGLGITLHAASTAVFYSLDFNYANYSQALARIHRIGQKRSCHYIHLLCEDTVDEKVMTALSGKEDMAKAVVDDWKKFF